MPKKLIDSQGRIAKKLRISVTDRCNMRCLYCMPKNNEKWLHYSETLSFSEITRLVSIFVDLGIEELRITGGEPLVRSNLELLIKTITTMPGIKSIGMTTNGLLLSDKVKLLSLAGLTNVNISLDSFKEDRFNMISGVSGVEKVITSIKDAANAGFDVKINTVIVRGWNDDEIVDFAMFARNTGHHVRFIEFMPLDGAGIWQPELVFSKREMIQRIERKLGPLTLLKGLNNNSKPASLYSFIDGVGIVGFISSVTEPFCNNCDRVRITSDGRLLTCLFENPGYQLKNLLRAGATDDTIKSFILDCMYKKPEGIIKLIQLKSLRPTLNLMHTIGG